MHSEVRWKHNVAGSGLLKAAASPFPGPGCPAFALPTLRSCSWGDRCQDVSSSSPLSSWALLRQRLLLFLMPSGSSFWGSPAPGPFLFSQARGRPSVPLGARHTHVLQFPAPDALQAEPAVALQPWLDIPTPQCVVSYNCLPSRSRTSTCFTTGKHLSLARSPPPSRGVGEGGREGQ